MDLTPSYDASENVQFFKIERKIEYIRNNKIKWL